MDNLYNNYLYELVCKLFWKKYYLNNDNESKEKYKSIMVFIFLILLVVYFYFVTDSYQDVKKLNSSDSDEKKKLVLLSFFGSLLIFISGIIFLYIAYSDENIDVEVAFN